MAVATMWAAAVAPGAGCRLPARHREGGIPNWADDAWCVTHEARGAESAALRRWRGSAGWRCGPPPTQAYVQSAGGAVLVAALWGRYGQRKCRLARHALAGIEQFKLFKTEDGEEFEIITSDVLGSGAQGTVYGARMCRTGQKVAVKVIPTWRLVLDEAGKDKLQAIEEEFATIKALGYHPNIAGMIAGVDIFTTGAAGSSFPHYKFLVMEAIDGRELAEHVALGGPMKESLARHLFLQVLDGLKHMHGMGVIHRDLKPENVLVTGSEVTLDSQVKLIDFGVAKCIRSGPLQTVVGTPSFMAPEIAKAKISYSPARENRHVFMWGQADAPTDQCGAVGVAKSQQFCPKIDVWSAGVVLYTCLTGKVPFKSELEIIESDYLRGPLGHISEEARDLIAGMLEKEPEKRLSIDQCVQHQWIACSETDGCTINWDVLEESVRAQP